MVEVEIGGMTAQIIGEEWTEGDSVLLRTLRQDLSIRAYAGYDPFPAHTIANEAIQRYGGRIIRQRPPKYVEGRIY